MKRGAPVRLLLGVVLPGLLPGLLGLAAGCEAGVRRSTGLEATLRAGSGSFVAGTISTAADPLVVDGRKVVISRAPSQAFPGQGSQPFVGGVRSGGVSVAVGLADDRAYWIIPAPVPNTEAGSEGELLFSSSLSFSPAITPGVHSLVMRAIGADGRMGDPVLSPLMISDADFTNVRGFLQVRLLWDSNADLDLHVVVPVDKNDLSDPTDPKAPTSIEVWANQPTSLPPRPSFDPYTPERIMAGGLLDYDSNAGCAIDGRRAENLVWSGPPLPVGHYTVRVDTPSLCGEVAAQWRVDVFKDGDPVPLAAARGESVDSDTRFGHTQGAGVLALEFDL